MTADPQQQAEEIETKRGPRQVSVSRGAKRFGYVVAAAINAALLVVVNNLLEWDVFPWLTTDFDRVVGILSLSLGISVVVNLAFAVYDTAWFKSVGQIVMSVIGFAAAVRLWQVFPFDFSAYEFDWELVARGVLVVAMVGVVISVLVELGRLGREVWRAT